MELENAGLLSQSEIDALLASVGGESSPAEQSVGKEVSGGEQYRRYDFRRPDRFSKEQMRALRMIHETWARRIAVSMSAHLRTSVEVALVDIDQGMYSGLSQTLLDQGIFFTLGLTPLAGHFVVHMSPDLATIIVDRLMGGPAIPSKTERRMTDLEIELLRDVAERLLVELREAWSSAYDLRPTIDDISQNLMLVPIALPTDAIVWAGFEVRAKGYTSGMTLAMPYPVLKPIATQLSPYTWVATIDPSRQNKSHRQRQEREASLAGLKLPVSVVLGSTKLGVGEVACLRPGDVIPLDLAPGGLCPVLINNRPKFLGRPGLIRRRLAVQIVSPIQSEEDDDAASAASVEKGSR